MKRLSCASLRVRLILPVLMAIIPALGITIYSGLEQRNQARLHALEDAQRLAQEISKDHDHLIQNARQTLFTLSKISQVQEQDKDTCCKISADIMKQSEDYTALAAAKPNGDLRREAERKRADEALRNSEEKFRTLFEESKDAILITTREGNFIDFNKSTLDLFGYNKEEMMGLNMQNLYVHSGERSKFQQEIEKKFLLKTTG